jgi:hypothetical protein
MSDEASRRWAAAEAQELLAAARADALREARGRLAAELTAELLTAVRATAGEPPADTTAVTPPAAGPTAGPDADPDAGMGLWLYGVVPGDVAAPPSVMGVDEEHRVELVREGPVAALVSAVPLDRFGADTLQRSLEDMTVLEALARGHERVLDSALALGAVVPFRLCTIYENDAHVRDLLERDATQLTAALDRLAGREEWGVKGFMAPAKARAASPAGASASGTDYLTRKREARDAVDSAYDAAHEAVAAIHDELAGRADAAVLSRPQDRRLSGREEEMVLNGSYLVAASEVEGFRALVDTLARRHRDEGIELEATGPWPAYHFVEQP